MRRASRGRLAVPSSEAEVAGAVGTLVPAVMLLSWVAGGGGGGGGNPSTEEDAGRSLALLSLIVLFVFGGLGAGLEEAPLAPAAVADWYCDVGACH